MIYFLFSRRLVNNYLIESRLIYQNAGIDGVPSFQGNTTSEMETFRNWRQKTEGAQELFDKFADRSDVTMQDLQVYSDELLIQKGNDIAQLPPFVRDIRDTMNAIKEQKNPAKAIEAEQRIQKLIDALNNRNKVISDAQTKRGEFAQEQELPTLTGKVLGIGKDVIGATVEGYQNSTGKEKAVMIAGLITGALMIRYAWNKIGFKGSFLKGTAGLLVTLMGFEAANKAVEKVRGVPLYSFRNGMWPEFPMAGGWRSPENFEKEKKAGLIESAYKELTGSGVPGKFLDQIGIAGTEKDYTLGVSNLTDLSVDQFGDLYEEHKGTHQILEESSLYGAGSVTKDNLTPAQRFYLVFDVGQTLGLIDKDGNFKKPEQPERANKKLLYLMLDWKN